MRFIALVIVGMVAACVPAYRAPTFDQPHSTLKLRRLYARSAGEFLSEQLLVDGRQAYGITVPSGSAAVPRTDAILVHPRAGRLAMSSVFFHEETNPEDQSTWVDVPYDDVESYDCGTPDLPQTCTRTVTKSRSELHHETVYRTVDVTDASCHREIAIEPAVDDLYLLQFDFVESGVCRLSCFQQVKQDDGTFTMRLCPAPREKAGGIPARAGQKPHGSSPLN